MRGKYDWGTARRRVHGRRNKSRCVRLLDNLPVRGSFLRIEGRRHNTDSHKHHANYDQNAFHHRTPISIQALPVLHRIRALPDKYA
jgi:hypothetical protein